jgi:hypothetical protein
MIKKVEIEKSKEYNLAGEPRDIMWITFVCENNRRVSTSLDFANAYHLLDWNGNNPVELLREVLELNKELYLWSSSRAELEKLLEEVEPHELDIKYEWLKREEQKLLEQLKKIRDEIENIEFIKREGM